MSSDKSLDSNPIGQRRYQFPINIVDLTYKKFKLIPCHNGALTLNSIILTLFPVPPQSYIPKSHLLNLSYIPKSQNLTSQILPLKSPHPHPPPEPVSPASHPHHQPALPHASQTGSSPHRSPYITPPSSAYRRTGWSVWPRSSVH